MGITVRPQIKNFAARSVFVAALTLCALTVAATGSAGAATYSVYACAGPSSEVLPNSSWLTSVEPPIRTPSFSFGTACGDLSVFADTGDVFESDDRAAYVFDAPAGTTISGYSVNRTASIVRSPGNPNPVRLSAGVRELAGATANELDCPLVVADCNVPPGVVQGSGLALTQLSVGVRCSEPEPGCPVGSFSTLSSQLRDARVDLEDPAAPSITAVGGSLPGSDGPAGVRTLAVSATDVGGGVAAIGLAVDGVPNQTTAADGSCTQPYILRAPCPSGLARTFDVNTATFTAGTHTATLTAVDAAGNASTPYAFVFAVSSGTLPNGGGGGVPPSNGSPAVEQPLITATKRMIRTSGRKPVTVTGTVTTPGGTPVAGASLNITALDLGVFDSAPKSIGMTTTSATGRYAVRIRPNGARRISLLFKPHPASLGTAVASTIVREELKLSIKRSHLKVKPGRSLKLSGRLTGAGRAAGHAPVEIDVRIGGGWRAVGVVDTNSHGRYKWRYRFVRVEQPTRFKFRAVVRRNRAWPWPNEKSKAVKVLVAR